MTLFPKRRRHHQRTILWYRETDPYAMISYLFWNYAWIHNLSHMDRIWWREAKQKSDIHQILPHRNRHRNSASHYLYIHLKTDNYEKDRHGIAACRRHDSTKLMRQEIHNRSKFWSIHFQSHDPKYGIGGDNRRRKGNIWKWRELIQSIYDNEQRLIQWFASHLQRTDLYRDTARQTGAIEYKKVGNQITMI